MIKFIPLPYCERERERIWRKNNFFFCITRPYSVFFPYWSTEMMREKRSDNNFYTFVTDNQRWMLSHVWGHQKRRNKNLTTWCHRLRLMKREDANLRMWQELLGIIILHFKTPISDCIRQWRKLQKTKIKNHPVLLVQKKEWETKRW